MCWSDWWWRYNTISRGYRLHRQAHLVGVFRQCRRELLFYLFKTRGINPTAIMAMKIVHEQDNADFFLQFDRATRNQRKSLGRLRSKWVVDRWRWVSSFGAGVDSVQMRYVVVDFTVSAIPRFSEDVFKNSDRKRSRDYRVCSANLTKHRERFALLFLKSNPIILKVGLPPWSFRDWNLNSIPSVSVVI